MLSETYLELLIPITDTLLQFLGIGLSVYTDYLPDLVPLAQYLQIHVYGLTDLACQQFDLTVVHVETGCPMDMLHVWHDQLNGLVEQTKKAALGFSHAWTEEPLNQTAFKESRITSAHQVLKSCFHLLEHLESMETLKKNTWFKIEKDHGETLMSLTEDTLEVKVAWLKKHIQRVPRLYQALLEHRVPNPRWERLCEEYAQTAKMLAWSVAFPLPYRLPHVHRYLSLCQQLQKPLPFETCTFTSPEPDRIWNLLQGLPHLTHSSLSTSIYLPFKSVGHPWNPMQWTSFVDNAQHLEKYLRPTSSELSSFLPILKSAAQALVASSTDALLLTYAQHVFSEWEKLVEWHLQFFHTSFLEFQVILVAAKALLHSCHEHSLQTMTFRQVLEIKEGLSLLLVSCPYPLYKEERLLWVRKMQDIVLPEHAISLESITRQGMADCKLHPLEVTVPNILLDQPVSLQFVEGSFDAFISCFQTWLSTFPSLPPPFLDCISTLTTYAQQVRKCCVSLFETPPNHFQNFEWISKLKSMMKIHAQLKALLPPTFTHSFTFVGHQCHLHFLLNQNVNEWIKTLVITILNLSNHIWAWYLEKQQRMLM